MNSSRVNRTGDDCPNHEDTHSQKQKEKAGQRLLCRLCERHLLNQLCMGREFCFKILQQIVDVKNRFFERGTNPRIYSDMFASETCSLQNRRKTVMSCRVEPHLPLELVQLNAYEEAQSHFYAIVEDVNQMTRALKLAVNTKIQLHRQIELIKNLESSKARRFEKIFDRTLKALSYETGIIYLFLILRCRCAFRPRMPINENRDFRAANCGDFHATCFQLWPFMAGLVILYNFLAALQILVHTVARQILWLTVYFS